MPCTRQKSGVFLKIAAFGPDGGTNVPAVTTLAELMIVESNFPAAILSQVAA